MTTDVVTARDDRPLLGIEDIMQWVECRHVPVVDADHRLLGLITERDLLRASLSCFEEELTALDQRQHLAKIAVRDAMRTDVVTIDPDATINAAARMMRRRKVGCLPVVSSNNVLLGILTEFDLLGILEYVDLGAARVGV